MIFFTSDHHFGHETIVKHQSNRQRFGSVAAMDAHLIKRWNETVSHGDLVYHLGDLSWKRSTLREVRPQLQGDIVLVRGNHDDVGLGPASDIGRLFKSVHDMLVVNLPLDADAAPNDKQSIVLLHYAMRVWPARHYGAWHLYGHSHGNLPDDGSSLSMDVGVDTALADFAPISLPRVAAAMRSRVSASLTAGDHHRPDSVPL